MAYTHIRSRASQYADSKCSAYCNWVRNEGKKIFCIRSIRFIGLFQVLLVYSTESAEMAQNFFFLMSKVKTTM